MYALLLQLVVALPVTIAFAAPVHFELDMQATMPWGLGNIADFFDMLATKAQQDDDAPLDEESSISNTAMPAVSIGSLPPPSPGLGVIHIAIGRGTQNYTCDTANVTAVPFSIGAKATLFNATMVAVANPDLLGLLPGLVLDYFPMVDQLDLPDVSGMHFFLDVTTPFFNLNTAAMQLGEIPASKNSSAAAPSDAPRGRDGEAAVDWLKLVAKNSTTMGNVREVYRVQTAGGGPPATCQDAPAAFELQYAAQ